MCITMQGEIRSKRIFQGKKGPVEVLRVLVNFGKYEEIVDVANFAKQEIKAGLVSLKVVPRVVAREGRAFLNWATYEGAV